MAITQVVHDKSKLAISWNVPTRQDFSHVIVKMGDESSTWSTASTILNNYDLNGEYIYQLLQSGTYNFFIKGVDTLGKESYSPAVITKTFMIEPITPTLVSVSQNPLDRTHVIVSWEQTEFDLVQFEICPEAVWNDNNVIVRKENFLDYKLDSEGMKTFLIKAVNVSGHKSAILTATINATFIPALPTAPNTNITRSAIEANKLEVVWNKNAETDIDHYEICYRTWRTPIVTKETKLTYTIADSNNHSFLIKAVSVAGIASPTLTLSSNITLNPTNATNLSITQSEASKYLFNVAFTPSVDTCIDHYIIKYGATWETAEEYNDVLTSPYQITIKVKQSAFVFIKAVNNKGYKSVNALSLAVDTVTAYPITPSAPFGAVFMQNSFKRDEITLAWNNDLDNDFKCYQIKPLGVLWSDISVKEVTSPTISFTIPSTGIYSYVIRVYDTLGLFSTDYTCTSSTLVLEPTSVATESITHEQSSFDKRSFTFKWNSTSEMDFDHYIVKLENVTEQTGIQVLSSNVTASYYNINLPTQDTYKLYITVVNKIGKLSTEVSYSMTPNLVPSAPTNVTYSPDATRRGRGIVSWTKIADADFDLYEVKLNEDDWSTAQIVTGTSATFTINTSGSYKFNVRAKNFAGFYSTIATLTTTVTVEPSEIGTFTATQSTSDKRYVELKWGTIADLDIDYFVVKEGTDWSTATLLSTQNSLSFSHSISTSGTYHFLIKAVNKQGKENVTAKSVAIVMDLTPSKPTPASVPFQTSPRDKSIVMLAWNGVSDPDLVTYIVRCNGAVLVETKETSYQYNIYTVGSYIYTVCAKNVAGYESALLSLYNGTLTLAPSNVSSIGFTITQSDLDSRTINFAWDRIEDTDVSFYEIRKGASWDTATTIATNVKSNYYQLIVNASTYADYEGTNDYMVKAVNNIGFYSAIPASITKIISFAPVGVSSGSAVSSPTNRFLITVTWNKVSSLDLDYYEVTYTPPSGVSQVAYRGKENSFVWDVTTYGGGMHTFSVKTKNLAGYTMSTAYNIQGNMTPYPSDVTNFSAEQSPLDKRIVNFVWDKNNDTDFSYFEIRKGATWDAFDSIIASNLTANYATSTVSVSESATYWIKAFNMGGKESQTPTSILKNLSLKPTTPPSGSAVHDPSDKANIILRWEAVKDTDLMSYELKLANTDFVPNDDLANLHSYPSNTYAVNQNNGYWRIVRGANTEILSNTTHAVSAGDTYTMSFEFKHDGTSIGFNFHCYTNHGQHSTPATIVDKGNNVKLAYATYTIEADGTYIRPLNIINFSGDWTYIDITNPKLEKVTQVKENFYNYRPNDLTTLSYDFFVTSKNIGGVSSDPLWLPFTADFHPSNVTNVTASQLATDHTQIKVEWEAIADKDIAYYIIKRGTDWNNPQQTYTVITQGFVWDTISTAGTYQWMVRAVNKAGLESADMAISGQYAFDMTPEVPANATATQDPTDRSKIYLTWQEQENPEAHQEDLQGFEVRCGATWESAEVVATTKELKATWMPSSSVVGVKVFVKALSNAGYYSDATSSITYSFTLEPTDVTNFEAIQNGTSVLFTWDKSPDADVYGYELREGSNFEGGNILATGITATQFSLPVDMETTRVFHLKAINRSGRYSLNQDSVTIIIKDLPVRNVISTYNEMPTDPEVYTGTHNNTAFGVSTINCSNIGFILGKYRCSEFTDEEGNPTTQCSEIGGSMVLKLAEESVGVYYSTGYYTTAIKDMGAKVTANIGTLFSATSSISLAGFRANLQYRTSQDNVTWKEWRNFIPVLATFQYIQFKVTLSTEDTAKTPEVPLFQEMIDVPDTDKHGTAVVLASGNTIFYDPYYQGQVYYTTPTVVATAIELGKIAVVKQDEIFLDRFIVKVYNYNDMTTPVSGTINWISKGY